MCEKVNFRLTSAIRRGSLDRVREIVHSDGLSYSEGYVLLVEAIRRRRTEIAKELLIYGCEVNSKNKKEHSFNTPLGLAIANGNAEIVEMLLHSGADTHVRGTCGTTVLHTAVQQGNRKIIKLLLNHGADVHVVNNNGLNPLHLASIKQNLQIAEDLLNHGAGINSVCTSTHRSGYTPLHLSSEQGNEEAVKLFLRKGADISANTSDNLTPLHIAVKAERKSVVKLLLEHGAKVDAQDKSGNTVLHLAVQNQYATIIEDILKYRPDINNQSNRNSFKIAVCGSRESYKEIVETLQQYGFLVSPNDVDCLELLCNALTKGYLKIIEDLLKNGADVNMLDNSVSVSGDTLLHSAAINKQDEVAKMLINYGANVNAKNDWGITPIFYAVHNSDVKITRLLLTNGADIKDSPELPRIAAANGHLEIVEELLKSGADVNTLDHSECGNGGTLLHRQVVLQQEKVVQLLLNYGANVNAIDKKGRTPVFYAVENKDVIITRLLLTNEAEVKDNPWLLHMAAASGHLEIVEDLLKSGTDVNMLEPVLYESAGTPLHSAVRKKLGEVAELLLNYGANVNAKDRGGRTPVFYAVENNDVIITRLLLTNGADIKDSPWLLHTAAVTGHLEIVENLLKCGADVNILDHSKYGNGGTLLHRQVVVRQKKIVQLLLNYGANVNAIDKKGRTPVFYAVRNRDAKITKLLLTNGAEIKDSPWLLHTAVASGCFEIMEDLLKYGTDVNMQESIVCGSVGTPLHSAVRKKLGQVAKLLLNYGANVNAKDKGGRTPLFYAVQNSDVKITRLLLTNGADVKGSIELLHTAAGNGRLEIVEDLLKHGTDVNILDHSKYGSGSTPLHRQVLLHQEEVVKLLVNYGADVNAKDKRGRTPLFYAVENNDVEITILLLTNGADTKDSPWLLHVAAAIGHFEIVEELLKCGIDVNTLVLDHSEFQSVCTPLHSAVRKKRWEVAKLLVNYGANVNAKDVRGKTPVFYAVQNRDAKMTKLLLTNGADVKDDPDLLHTITRHGCLEIIEDLLKYGVDVNTISTEGYGSGYAPLHIAVQTREEEVSKLLIHYGANVNVKDRSGRTPVFYAIENYDKKITKLLLTKGADIKDDPELLPSAVNKCLEIVEDLLKYGADVNVLDHSKYGRGGTPLHRAVREHHDDVVAVLISHGANVNAKDKTGKTPLFYAVESSNPEITRLLLTNGADMKGGPELLYIAIEKKCAVVVDFLLKHGVNVNVIINYYTPLEFAIYNCNAMSDEDNDDYDSDSYSDSDHYDMDRAYKSHHVSPSVEIVQLLKKHISKLQIAGLYVSDTNLELIIDDDKLINFQCECEGEIEIMKCEEISNSYVSFYDILTKNKNQITIYANNENIVQAIKSADYKTKFPIYASMIEEKFRKALERKELMELGNQLFHSLFDSLPKLPFLCVEKIFSYLSTCDIKLLIHT